MVILDTEVVLDGRFLKRARLRNEHYDFIGEPARFIEQLMEQRMNVDLFTFLPEIHDCNPRHPYYYEWDSISVLPLTTYENWWKNQISDKTRNMARKAGKKGVEVRAVDFDDQFVQGIVKLNNESPMRQGRPYWHYRKDFETVKREHSTFLDQSKFLGAFLGSEMIGYIKLVNGNGKASIMQILSLIRHRDKAPNNALMAKAVEICTQENMPFLHYASWSSRGLGEFKINHGFEKLDVPRYYVPLTRMGKLVLKTGLHRRFTERLPAAWIDKLATLRGKWYEFKLRRSLKSKPADEEPDQISTSKVP